ncbi:MAG: non-canonical purine NTP pyrophosphatase [Anaerolineaceae bacterium]|nr:non-canonical purine NTP pyrophosphatase [Anaerolineaceae bacterium]
MKPLLIATQNPGKTAEFLSLLGACSLPLTLLTTEQLGIHLDVLEDGQTYAENAARKALAFCSAAGIPALADDSGLEVEALNGEPGLYSARYAPPVGEEPWLNPLCGGDARRRARLLHKVAAFPRPWRAAFHCTLALAHPDGRLEFAAGRCPGEVIPEERGSGGFGYDPIFLLPELGLTMAELSTAQKNQLSHRARAVQAAMPLLRALAETRSTP